MLDTSAKRYRLRNWRYAAVLNSNQVGTSPVNGYYLQTNGATSTWAAVAGGSGVPSTTPWTIGNLAVVSSSGALSTISSSTYITTSSISIGGIFGNVFSTNNGIQVSATGTIGLSIPLSTAYGGTATTTALGSNAFNSTAIPTTYVSTYNGVSGAVTHSVIGSGNVTSSNATSGSNTTTTLSITGIIGASNGGTATTTALGSYAFLSSGLPSIATTTKAVYDNAPAATDDIPLFYSETGYTIKQVDCVNDAAVGNTVTWNLIASSTRGATTSQLVFASGQTCTSTSTVTALTSFASSTIPAGDLLRVVFSAASSTGVYIDFKF